MIGAKAKDACFDPLEDVFGIGNGSGAIVAGADGRIRTAARFRAPALPARAIRTGLGAQSLGLNDYTSDGFAGGVHHANKCDGMSGCCETPPDEAQCNDGCDRCEYDQSSDGGFPHCAPLVWREVKRRRSERQPRVKKPKEKVSIG